MTELQKHFEWSDAWVFVSLFGNDNTFKTLDLSHVIGMGDMLNHAIFTPEELRQGFEKLINKGFIEIKDLSIRFLDISIAIEDEIKNENIGFLSMVDSTLKKINSPMLKLNNITVAKESIFEFLSNEAIDKGYENYRNSLRD